MHPKTEQLLASLEIITEGLWYSTASDYRIYPFVWEVSEKGEFNLVRFLIDRNNLRMVEPRDFDRAWWCATKKLNQTSNISNSNQQPVALIEELQSHLTDLEFYSFGTKTESLSSLIVVGRTADNAWVGLTNFMHKHSLFRRDILIIKDGYTTPQADILKARIEPLLEKMKLLLSTEWGRNPEIVWEVAESQTQVLIKLLTSSQFVESYKYNGFHSEGLNNFLTSQLKQLQSYVVDWSIYAVGQIPDGDWLGVATSGYWN